MHIAAYTMATEKTIPALRRLRDAAERNAKRRTDPYVSELRRRHRRPPAAVPEATSPTQAPRPVSWEAGGAACRGRQRPACDRATSPPRSLRIDQTATAAAMLTAVPVGVAAVIGRPKPASRARKAGRPARLREAVEWLRKRICARQAGAAPAPTAHHPRDRDSRALAKDRMLREVSLARARARQALHVVDLGAHGGADLLQQAAYLIEIPRI